MKNKVLLTGANGLLGSYILRWLLDNGIEVKATRRKTSDFDLIEDIKDKVEWVEGDMTDYPIMEKAMDDCNIVIHSAAVVSYSKKDKDTMIEINVNGTANLINIALAKNVDYFIQISSISAVGRPKLLHDLDETTKWEESPHNSTYAKSKFYSELEVWRGISEGLNAVILNPSFILGPGDWNRSSTQLFKFVWKENRFYTDGLLNFVDVRDVVKAIDKLFHKRIKGERFIISGGNITFQELFGKMALRWNKKKPSTKINPIIAGIVWRLESIRTTIFGGNPVITKESVNSALGKYYLNSNKSKTQLGMEYRSLDETLDWVCEALARKTE